MRALINGVEGGALDAYIGADTLFQVILVSDGESGGDAAQITPKGKPLDVTGDTVTIECYDTTDRRNAASISIPCTIVTAAGGYLTALLTNANAVAALRGTRYAFIKRLENVASIISFSEQYAVIKFQ